MDMRPAEDDLPSLQDILCAELAGDPMLLDAESSAPTLFDLPVVAPDPENSDSPLAPEPCPSSLPARLLPLVLTLHSGKAKGARVPVRSDSFWIGRQSDCHLKIHHEVVSRRHCVLRWRERWYLQDESTHGTTVNGVAIHGREVPLDPGDEIGVGPLRFTVAVDDRQPSLSRFQFQTAVQAGPAVRLLKPTAAALWSGFFPVPAAFQQPPPSPIVQATPGTGSARLATVSVPQASEPLPLAEVSESPPPVPSPDPPVPEPANSQRLNQIYRTALQPLSPESDHVWFRSRSLLAAVIVLAATAGWYWFVPSGRHTPVTERSGTFTPVSLPLPAAPNRPQAKPGRPGRRGMVAPYYG